MSEKQRLEKLWELYPTTWRHDVGAAWVGGQEFEAKKSGAVPVKKGDRIIKNPGRIKYGLATGAGDLIGYETIEITADMVGQKVAVFTSVEDKSATDRIGLEQLVWLLRLRIDGAMAEVFREGEKLSLEQVMSLPRRKSKDAARLDKVVGRLYEQITKRSL